MFNSVRSWYPDNDVPNKEFIISDKIWKSKIDITIKAAIEGFGNLPSTLFSCF